MIVESSLDDRGIRTITLNRPPVNAINIDMIHAVRDAFDAADRDWATRVVVLDSSSPGYFTAGWDIKQTPPAPGALPEAVPEYSYAIGRDVFRAIRDCGVPVIAKVRGVAIGAGFLYACLADFIVASETARFGQFEIRIGAVGGAGIVRRAMSEQAMRYFTWTGDLVDARELAELGAGIKVVPDAELDARVDRIAALLAARDPKVNRHTKNAMNQVEELGALESYAVEQLHTRSITASGAR